MLNRRLKSRHKLTLTSLPIFDVHPDSAPGSKQPRCLPIDAAVELLAHKAAHITLPAQLRGVLKPLQSDVQATLRADDNALRQAPPKGSPGLGGWFRRYWLEWASMTPYRIFHRELRPQPEVESWTCPVRMPPISMELHLQASQKRWAAAALADILGRVAMDV